MSQSKQYFTQCLSMLQKADVFVTPIRRALLVALSTATQPLSARELLAAVQDQGVAAHRATVYRDIELCVAHGLVNAYTFKSKHGLLYELATDHHHHLVCEACGTVVSIYPNEVETAIATYQERVSSERAFQISSHRLKFYGLCSVCRVEKKQEENHA